MLLNHRVHGEFERIHLVRGDMVVGSNVCAFQLDSMMRTQINEILFSLCKKCNIAIKLL